jgi:hypothetical protein
MVLAAVGVGASARKLNTVAAIGSKNLDFIVDMDF